MKNMKKEEIEFIQARTLSKVISKKSSSKVDACKTNSTVVQTGHCTPVTVHSKKEIGPGGI